jgi:hypothetical protein
MADFWYFRVFEQLLENDFGCDRGYACFVASRLLWFLATIGQ